MKSVQNLTRNRVDEIAVSVSHRIESIRQRHEMNCDDAIDIGEMISEAKELLGHGDFLPWVADALKISNKWAEQFMRLYRQRTKIELSSNFTLTEMFRLAERIETDERQQQRRDQAAQQKPANRKPLVDLAPEQPAPSQDEKRQADEAEEAFNGRVKEHFDRPSEKPEERKRDPKVADLLRRSQEYLASHKKTEDFAMADLGENGSQDAMFLIITRYVSKLGDVSRQMEAAHNLIKFLKQLVNELQRQSVDSEQGGES